MKTKISIVLAAVLLLVSSYVQAEHIAGNKWKVTSIVHSGSSNLTGDDLLFKITIKNILGKKSSGSSQDFTIKVYGGSTLIATKQVSISPGILDDNAVYSFIGGWDTHETQLMGLTYQKITCSIQSSDTDGMSETFDVKRR